MAEIRPFRGILYNTRKAAIGNVVTPPYDVISPAMQRRFYQMDRHNIIRLVLGREEKNDTPNSNKYTRAGKLLAKWLRERVLVKDKKPAIYVYTQEYLHKQKKKTRIGFIALMKIEDPKDTGVLPHEYTLEKPLEDRMNLIENTKANLSPVFSLFQDGENRINKILKNFIVNAPPLFLTEQEGVLHRLWRLQDRRAIEKVKNCMRKKKIFIADGHHRYEVALAYRNKMRPRKGFKKSMDYVMMYFSNLSEKGNLTILSTHRVINKIDGFSEKKALHRLSKYFKISTVKNVECCIEYLERIPRKGHAFGMYAGERFYILTPKSARSLDEPADSNKARSLQRLDVTILHDLIIDKVLGLKNTEKELKYVRNEKDASLLVEKGDYQIAFFLRPTAVSEMKRVAETGDMMPQKSTYFYPKLLTGLVINKF